MFSPRIIPCLALLLLTPFAGAEPRRPTAAKLGTPKEESSAAARPPAPPQVDRDVALGRALLFAFEPAPIEIRKIAIEDLGLLGDERVLNVLAQLLVDANTEIERAALVAVRRYQSPRAEEILSNVLRHPHLGEPIKLLAIEALPYQGTGSARQTLERIASTSSFGYNLRSAAQRTLSEWSNAVVLKGDP